MFGSTPRLFIQGTEVNNIIDSTVVNPFLNQLSNYEIKLEHKKTSPTDAFITATIIKRATDTQTSAKLYLAIGEDSVAYAAPNGINTHYGVMRKALTDSSEYSLIFQQILAIALWYLKDMLFPLHGIIAVLGVCFFSEPNR